MKDKKRFLVYAYYDRKGVVHDSTLRLLKEFRSIIEYIIFVSNSFIYNSEKLKGCVDYIIVRENKGYDAGAYSEVLRNTFFSNILCNMDEIVFCNNSFWGPFISITELFNVMEMRKADFWGIAYSGKNLVHHLQSYFMVFEEKIVRSGLLQFFFQNYISEKEVDYREICRTFEIGLNDYLLSRGYVCDAYVKNICYDPYMNPYGSLKYDGLPIIKKKIFSGALSDSKQIYSALGIAKKKFGVDIKGIMLEAQQIYGIDIFENVEIENILVNAEINQNGKLKDWREVKKYIDSRSYIFLLGCGYMMQQVLNHFFSGIDRNKLAGIIAIGKLNDLSDEELKDALQDYENYSIIICVDDEEVQISFDKLVLNDSFNIWKSCDEYRDANNVIYISESIIEAMGRYFYYREPLAVIDETGLYCGMLTSKELENRYTFSEDTTILAIANTSVQGFVDVDIARNYVKEHGGVAPIIDDEGKFIRFIMLR